MIRVLPMKRVLVAVVFCSLIAQAANFKPARVVEIRDASEVGANTVTNNSEGVIQGNPTFVPALLSRCQLTVELDGTNYTALYPVNKHLKITDYNPGDSVPARIEGNKLVIKTLDGKEVKAKIASRQAHAPKPSEKSAGK